MFIIIISRPNFNVIENGLNVLLSLMRSYASSNGSPHMSRDCPDGLSNQQQPLSDIQDFYLLLSGHSMLTH